MPSPLRARLRALGAVRPLGALGTAFAALVAVVALPATGGAAPSAPDSGFHQQVLFRADQDPGYTCFRIPTVVKTKAGTLLAFAEGRVHDCGDAGDIDIVVKRSDDDGRTWSGLSVVNDGGGDTHGNPVPLVDRDTGRVLVAETYNTGRTDGASCPVPCDRSPHLQYSDDDGRSWSKPRDLSSEIMPAAWNSWYATGPVHGLQLEHGDHKGRLVFGVNTETWAGDRVSANHAALIVSDDGGDHWRIGASDTYPISPDGTFPQKPSEMALAERADGSVYVSGREQDGTDLGHRTVAVSADGGDTFSSRFTAVPDLYAPQVQGSLLRTGNRMLLACPGDPDRRRTMMIRSSYDGGRTWDSVDRGRVVTTDWSGYSDMVQADAHTVGLVYEGGAVDARDEIRFVRFGENWPAARRGPDPTTDDLAPGEPAASVLGGAGTTRGKHGNALAFDGVDDAVRLPFRREQALGDEDFTASLWFRYSATSGEQPLLWMGGVGTTQPQVWLRAEPENNRVTGLITTKEGASDPATVSVNSTGAYNDGTWHHAALRRSGGALTLFLDNTSYSVPDVPGSVSRNSPFGVHIGQRMDSRAFFKGAIDDVRVYSRGLSTDEVQGLKGNGPATAAERRLGTPVIWLPMDDVDTRD
ncbi:exo-alpha-sialidase [Streptomyces sp. NPDC050560]|uniref:exo-alpha-sialidase n=1 Tax=Streptomyces sp. NPDC050560 TaxID=3365630 RepID=UPI0037A3AE20